MNSRTAPKRQPRDRAVWLVGLLLALIILSVLALLIIAHRSSQATSRQVHVVAAENFWGNIAAQIGGSKVMVTSIITNPNADPHLYESDAHDAASVATANVVVENGLGYDDFMSKLLAASPNSRRTVVSAQQVLGVTGADPNPHLWYDTPRVPTVAAAIEQALAAKDPADADYFRANLTTFDQSLTPILNIIAEIKTRYPNTPVAYTERVPGYLLNAAGLSVKTPPGFASAVEDGTDPSPSDTLAFDSLITSHSIKVLLYNAQTISSVTQQISDLATSNHIPVVPVTETMPAGVPTYQAWQLDQAKALLTALGG